MKKGPAAALQQPQVGQRGVEAVVDNYMLEELRVAWALLAGDASLCHPLLAEAQPQVLQRRVRGAAAPY